MNSIQLENGINNSPDRKGPVLDDVMFWHSAGTSVSWHAHFVDFAPGFLFSYIFHFSCLQLKLSVVNVRLNFKTSANFFLDYLEVHSQNVIIGCVQEESIFFKLFSP
jgi:hypothetical protein